MRPAAAELARLSGDYLLARNEGDFAFHDVTAEAGLSGWEFARGAAWLDVDNNGLLDLLVLGNSPWWPLSKWLPAPARLFYQFRPGKFVDVGEASGIANPHVGTSPVLADFNRDGLLDLLLVNRKGPVQMLLNAGHGNRPGHWMGIRLRGHQDGNVLGARVAVILKDGTRMLRQLLAGATFMSDHDKELFFGLGRRTQVDSVRVYWPSGKYTRLDVVKIDRHIGFMEPGEKRQSVMIRHPMLEGFRDQARPARPPRLECR
jgi:hypothetical protein